MKQPYFDLIHPSGFGSGSTLKTTGENSFQVDVFELIKKKNIEYARKAQFNRVMYYFLRILVGFSAALLPFLIGWRTLQYLLHFLFL